MLQQGTTIATTTGIHQGSPFHNPDTEHYGAGVEAAQQRLADAGVDASSISFSVDYIPPVQLAQAEYVVQVLQDIGFEAELNISPDFPTWATRVATGEHQMTLNNVWNWGDPVIGVHRSYLSTNNVGAIWTNNTGYNNPQVDALLAQAGSTFDVAERIDLYHQMQTLSAALEQSEEIMQWINASSCVVQRVLQFGVCWGLREVLLSRRSCPSFDFHTGH